MQQKGRGRLAKSAALDRVTGKMPESVAFERAGAYTPFSEGALSESHQPPHREIPSAYNVENPFSDNENASIIPPTKNSDSDLKSYGQLSKTVPKDASLKPSKIAVLIPCYNEAITIEKVVTDFRHALPTAEIFVYDNNSKDDTSAIARRAGAHVIRERRQGKGNVVRSMFRDIEADVYLMADGDDTYPADAAPEMIAPVIRGDADMVIGDRLSTTYFQENKRAGHNFGNRLVRLFINTFWPRKDDPIVDVMTGYRAFSRRFVKSFPVISQGFEIETEMTIHALDKNLLLTSIPISYRDRPVGSFSKLSTVKDGIRVLLTIFNLFREYKPLQFFSLAWAGLFFLVALTLFCPVFFEYLQTGLVDRLPTFIASGIAFVVSLMLFVCGLVLDGQARTARKQFELLLNLLERRP